MARTENIGAAFDGLPALSAVEKEVCDRLEGAVGNLEASLSVQRWILKYKHIILLTGTILLVAPTSFLPRDSALLMRACCLSTLAAMAAMILDSPDKWAHMQFEKIYDALDDVTQDQLTHNFYCALDQSLKEAGVKDPGLRAWIITP